MNDVQQGGFIQTIMIILCLMPQNDWLNYHELLSWGIYRNTINLCLRLDSIHGLWGTKEKA